jgi:peroxiredoxin
LGGFSEHYSELQSLGATVLAASTDTHDNTQVMAADTPYPVCYGVTREQAERVGAWWEDRRGLIQPSDFILGADGNVLSATYSTGPVGRLEAADAVRFIQFQEKLKQQSA